MSGWISKNWPRWFAKISYSRVPAAAKTAVDQIDQQWDKMDGKTLEPPKATITQKEVNITFRKKEDMIRRHSFPKR